MRALAVVDGEHYARRRARRARRAAVRVRRGACSSAGREKLRGGEDYGVPLVDSLAARSPSVRAGARRRPLRRAGARAARAASAREPRRSRSGCRYVGRRLPLRPARAASRSPLPSLAVIGTGKRVGKTAVTGHARARCSRATATSSSSRWAAAGRPSRRSSRCAPTLDDLLELSRAGRHAASDYLETAALAGVRDDRLPALRRRPRRAAVATRTCSRAPRWRPSSRPTSSSSTAAAPRSRRSTPAAASSSSARRSSRRRDRLPERVPRSSSPTSSWSPAASTSGSARRSATLERTSRSCRCDAAAAAGRAASQGGASPSSRPPRPAHSTSSAPAREHGADVVARLAATSPTAASCATSSRAIDAEVLPGRAQGSRDRRRRRGSARARGASVVFADNERRAAAGRARPRRRARSPRRRGGRGGGAARDRAGATREPLPLGGEDGLPYSKGLMARALIAAGAVGRRARTSSRSRVEADLAERGEAVGRPRAAARSSRSDVLGDERGRDAVRRLRRYQRAAGARPADHPARRRRRPAPASRRSRPRSPTGSGSRASPRPTSSARRCARSSRRSSCPSIHYSSFEAGPPADDEARGGRRGARSASSTRPGTCSSASQAVDRARARRGLVDGARGRPPRARDAAARDRGRARRPVRARDRRRGRPREPLLDPRRRLRGRPARRASTSTRFDEIRLRPGATSSSGRASTTCP